MSKEFRENLIDTLRLISDPHQQIKYEEDVPIANVPAELISIWFDDLYITGTQLFQESFSEPERELLRRFNQYYDERAGDLPIESGVEGLHASPKWQEIQQFALETLQQLEQAASKP